MPVEKTVAMETINRLGQDMSYQIPIGKGKVTKFCGICFDIKTNKKKAITVQFSAGLALTAPSPPSPQLGGVKMRSEHSIIYDVTRYPETVCLHCPN